MEEGILAEDHVKRPVIKGQGARADGQEIALIGDTVLLGQLIGPLNNKGFDINAGTFTGVMVPYEAEDSPATTAADIQYPQPRAINALKDEVNFGYAAR